MNAGTDTGPARAVLHPVRWMMIVTLSAHVIIATRILMILALVIVPFT
jgi:hypothetical protein